MFPVNSLSFDFLFTLLVVRGEQTIREIMNRLFTFQQSFPIHNSCLLMKFMTNTLIYHKTQNSVSTAH